MHKCRLQGGEIVTGAALVKGINRLIKIKVDPHTHTIASGHAFSTVQENAFHAGEMGLEAIAMTDHFGPMFWGSDGPRFGTDINMQALPKVIYGVRILAGTEICIVDFDGNLAGQDIYDKLSGKKSLCDFLLDSREVTIASLHYFEGMENGTAEQFTDMYCNVAKNSKVDIIGHCGRMNFPFDIKKVLLTAKENNTCIEINSSTLYRKDAQPKCEKIARYCKELEVPIVVGSDAHSSFYVGEFGNALTMLERIDFPEELVINSSAEKFFKFFGIER